MTKMKSFKNRHYQGDDLKRIKILQKMSSSAFNFMQLQGDFSLEQERREKVIKVSQSHINDEDGSSFSHIKICQ